MIVVVRKELKILLGIVHIEYLQDRIFYQKFKKNSFGIFKFQLIF